MSTLVRWLVAVCSLTFLSRYIGDKPISLALVICAAIAVWHFASSGGIEDPEASRWRRPFLIFVAIGLGALAISPFGQQAVPKGAIQGVGLLVMIYMASAIVQVIRERPAELVELVRVACLVAGGLAAIAIIQSVVANVLRAPIDFSMLNDLAGGDVWREPGYMGPILRANALCREPAHFCLFLGIGAGPAAIRVGLIGRRHRDAIAEVLSYRVAVVILTGFILSLSLLGYVQLLLTAGAAWLVSRKIEPRSLVVLATQLAAILLAIVLMAQQTGSALLEKVGTLAFIADPELATQEDELSLSALTIATHLDVLSQTLPEHPLLGIGLGAHPIAYDALAPEWSQAIEGVWHLNADDGASLLLRMLSETGMLGTLAFCFGAIALFRRARNAIQDALDRLGDEPPPAIVAVSIGVAASMAAVTLTCLLRYPAYYEALVWILFAFTAAVPFVLARPDPAAAAP